VCRVHGRASSWQASSLRNLSALDVSEVEICPWALREGIMLHYLQSLGVDSGPMPLQPVEQSDAPSARNGNRPAGAAVIPTSSRH
jgi:hypothetical protein